MDSESSSKFIGSLTKFLQSLCNGYVEFEDGVELIGHIYLSVDTGKRGKKIDYILNEKVCKSDNSVTFISNSFHAQPEPKVKAASGKEGDSKNDGDTSDSEARSTNVGTIPHRASQASRSLPSPNQHRTSAQAGTKRPGSPLKAPTPPQRRAPTPPSQRRMQSSGAKGSAGSPASKNVPSSPSSSSQDNIPSPSSVRKRSETSQPPSNQSDTAGADNESDNLVPPNIVPINPTPDLASFLGSLTGDNQSSRDQRSPQTDTKPDTDVTFIKEEFVSEPSSCAQAGSSGQHPGRSGDDGSGLYPVMLHQNTSVFPSTSAGYPPGGFSGGASATATSQQPAFPGSSTSQSDLFNPVPGTSQDGADPSVIEVGVSSGPRQFHSPQYPVSTASQQAWPHQRLPHASVEDHVWSPGSGRYVHLPIRQQVFGRSASSEPVLKQAEMHHQSAASTACQSIAWAGGGHPLAEQDSRFMPGHDLRAHSGCVSHPLVGHASQSFPTGQSTQSQSGSAQPRQVHRLSSEGLSPPDIIIDVADSFSCPLCPYSFAVDGQLSDHVRIMHKKSICVVCNKVFNSFASLCYHRNVKHGHRDHLKCSVCGKFFGHKQHMRSHMINVHKDHTYMM